MRLLKECADVLGQASIEEAYLDCTKAWCFCAIPGYLMLDSFNLSRSLYIQIGRSNTWRTAKNQLI
jgi:hypothetical protein